MRVSLTAETTQRIREALGNDIDLTPDVVPGVLARLAVEAPAVYSQVLQELSGSQILLDSEKELRRRRRRGLVRRLLFSWGEYETGAGDRLLDKRHVTAAVPLALAVLTMTLLAFALVVGHRIIPSPAQRSAIIQRPPKEMVRPETRIPSLVAPRTNPAMRDEVIGASRLSPSGSWERSAITGGMPMPTLPPGVGGLADFPAVAGRGLGSPVVVSLQARETGARGEPGPGAPSPVVYTRSADADSAQRGTVGHPADVTAPRTAESAPGARAANGSGYLLGPGMRIPATLLTGIIVTPGGPPVPVVVETATPRGIWVGQAVLGSGDRVEVALVLASHDRPDAARGIALDPEHLFPGLLGRTTVRHSSAATALATAALQAASDYAQAGARQGSITVLGGFGPLAIGGQGPEPWTYLAARLAQEFQARGTAGGWVTTTEISVGTPLTILVTGAS
jgi:hypothetical protein